MSVIVRSQCCDLKEQHSKLRFEAQDVFFGLLSKVTSDYLARRRYRHLVLFDPTDYHNLMWDDTDASRPAKRALESS